jgi:predicted Zn-dependent protease
MQKIKLITAVLLLIVLWQPAVAKPKKAVTTKKNTVAITLEEQRKLDYFFYDALRQRQLGHYDRAIDLLTECYYINPQSAAVAHEFAVIYSDFQDTPHALAFMQQAVRLDPSNIWYKKSYAELLVKNESLNDAIEVYEEIARLTDDEEIDYMLASLYQQTGKTRQSIAALDRLESKMGIDPEITMEKFGLYMHIDKKKQAYHEIDRLIEKYPQNVEHRLWRGAAYMVEEKPAKALQQFEIARQIEAGNPKVAFSLFSFYAAEGDSARANQVYTDLYADPNISFADKLASMEMAVYYSLQDDAQMKKHYQVLVAQYPDNEQLFSHYVDFLMMQENSEEATQAVRDRKSVV